MRTTTSGFKHIIFIAGVLAIAGFNACAPGPLITTTVLATTIDPNLLLPDLQSEVPDFLHIQDNEDTGRRELRFSTIVINFGEGPLEMVGAYDEALGETRAVQRILTRNGGFEERVSGYFVFHPDHDHWHFEDFVQFEIFALDSTGMPSTLVRTSGKTTYCLHDVFRLSSPPPGSPLAPTYPACDAKVQGISTGWADVYDMSLAGQQIDIEGLPDGRYQIKSTVDPANLVLERDETNNSITAIMEIEGNEVSVIGVSPPAPASHSVEIIAGNLEVPWAIAFAPDGRIFFTERPGRIRVIQNGILLAAPWLSIEVAAVGEGGLLGLAIDPGFMENHYLYASYTYRGEGGALYNRLVRLREDTSSRKSVLDKVLIESITGGGVHDGGRVKIGPDGKLYWTMGEAGSPALAQDVSSLNGKILRINTDGTIPSDNPFPGSPVYSYGHRNPQGLAWQPGTGRLYATEHGPSGGTYGIGQDEVNYIEPGKNYGWPLIIGDGTRAGMVSPVLQSGSSETWAPSGAAFISSGLWDGSFLFTGLRGQSLYRMVPDKNDPRKIISFEKLFRGEYGRLRDVAQGPDGMIYILTNNRDGRGSPQKGDDKILRLKLE